MWRDLSGNNFTGPIPEAIKQSPSLVHLYNCHFNCFLISKLILYFFFPPRNLSSNSFEGEIPITMGSLVQLLSLSVLHTEKLTTKKKNSSFCNFLFFPRDLSGNKLSGSIPWNFKYLKNLVTLWVSKFLSEIYFCVCLTLSFFHLWILEMFLGISLVGKFQKTLPGILNTFHTCNIIQSHH